MSKPINYCTVPGCEERVRGLGFCSKHYDRFKRHGDPTGGGPFRGRTDGFCSVDGCERPVKSKQMCSAHYQRLLKYGSATAGGTFIGDPMRFYQDVVLHHNDRDDCLTWPFAKSGGYGQLVFGDKKVLVSRKLCEETHGAAPTDKHEAAHNCGKGHEGCVNRNHIQWKTREDNLADKIIHDTHMRGERHHNSKLSEHDVDMIFELSGEISQSEIARRLGVTPSNISHIVNGDSWAWRNKRSEQ